MKKILLAFDDLGLGGIQTKFISIANKLAEDEANQVFFLLKQKTSFDRRHQINKKVKILVTPNYFCSIIKGRYYYLLLILILFLQPYSVLVSQEKTALFLLRRKKYWQSVNLAKTKIVVNIDIFLKEVQQQPTSLISRVLNQANNVVAVSKDVYNDLSKRIKINSPPLLLINNWTTVSRKDHLPEKNSKNVEFIFAGRLAKQKQPWLLIEFMKKVTKINSQAILEIYGSGPLRENLKKQIGQAELKKNIILKNPVKNIEKKLAKAKYLLLFSKFEGLPFIALESMKQGGVLLVLDNPGLRDIVVDEKTGIKKKNIQEVFLAWKKLENNTKRYALLQKEAFNLVNKKFNHKNLEQYITLLQ